MESHFYNHLKDAIIVNCKRKKLYAKMSANRSLWISQSLILLEKFALIFGYLIDRRASKFQKKGVSIIANDFVEMQPIPSHDTVPLYCSRADKPTLQLIARNLKNYRKLLKGYLGNADFFAAAKISYDFLQDIRQMEIEKKCHFAMTRHLVESIGFAALHAPQYAKASGGATVSLSKNFIQIQMLSLSGGLWLDKQAGAMHQMGIGILVNDVPLIPFEEEFCLTWIDG